MAAEGSIAGGEEEAVAAEPAAKLEATLEPGSGEEAAGADLLASEGAGVLPGVGAEAEAAPPGKPDKAEAATLEEPPAEAAAAEAPVDVSPAGVELQAEESAAEAVPDQASVEARPPVEADAAEATPEAQPPVEAAEAEAAAEEQPPLKAAEAEAAPEATPPAEAAELEAMPAQGPTTEAQPPAEGTEAEAVPDQGPTTEAQPPAEGTEAEAGLDQGPKDEAQLPAEADVAQPAEAAVAEAEAPAAGTEPAADAASAEAAALAGANAAEALPRHVEELTGVEAGAEPSAEPPAAAGKEAEDERGGLEVTPEGLEVLGAPVRRLPPGLPAPAGEESRPESCQAPLRAEPALESEERAAVEAEAAAEPDEGATRVEVTLEAEEARQLFAAPSITSTMSGKQVASPRQHISIITGARIDGGEPAPGEHGPVRLTVESDCPQKTRRALKYIRLVRTANQWWTKISAADDDGDLTVMEVPEALHQFILGRQSSALLCIGEDTDTLAFAVDDSQPAAPAAPSTLQPSQRPPVPWLVEGSRVEVKRGGDIRKGCWAPGTVVEALRFGTARVRLDGAIIECTADLSNSRPHFQVGDEVEMRTETEWAGGAVIQEQREDGQYAVRIAGGELAEVSWRNLRRHEETPEEAPPPEAPAAEETPPQVEEPKEAAEPMVRLAIFGDVLKRCAAQLSFMRAVDKKRQGFYANAPVHLCHFGEGTAPGSDWGFETLELEQEVLPKYIGTKGAMRRKLAHVAEAAVEYLGTTAYICGPRQNRAFVVALLETLRNSERGDVSKAPPDAMQHCRELQIPEDTVSYVMGASRSYLNKIEEEEGVITFLQAPEPQPEQEQAWPSGEEGEKQEAGAEAAPEGAEAEAAAEGAEEEDGSGAAAGNAALPPLPATRSMLIFALSERRRALAGLRVMAAVESKHPGFFSSAFPIGTHEDEPGLSTDILELDAQQAEWVSGKQGAARKKLQAASGCGVECLGHLAVLIGVREERERAQQYLQWVLDQKGGPEGPLLRLPSSAEAREDVLVVQAQESDRSYLDAEALATIEQTSGTLIFFRQQPAMEVVSPNAYVQVQRGGQSFTAKVVEAVEADGAVSLRLVLCEEGAEEAEAEQLPQPLLIFGHDAGPSGFTGRALAERMVRERLAEARHGPPATSSEAPATEANGAWAHWNEEESWHKEDNSWHGGKKHAWGGAAGAASAEDDGRRGGGRKNARGGGASSAAAGAEDDGGRHGGKKHHWGGGAAAAAVGEAQAAQGWAAGGRQRPGASAPGDGSANPWESWDASKVVLPEDLHRQEHRQEHRQDRRQDRRQAPDPGAGAWENWDASKVVLDSQAGDAWGWQDRGGGDWGGGGGRSGWGGGRWGR